MNSIHYTCEAKLTMAPLECVLRGFLPKEQSSGREILRLRLESQVGNQLREILI